MLKPFGKLTPEETERYKKAVADDAEREKKYTPDKYTVWLDDYETAADEIRDCLKNMEMVNHFNYVSDKGEVFCKRHCKVMPVSSAYEECDSCPYLFGSLQGRGVECMWEDVKPDDVCGRYVYDPYSELERVCRLIDIGVLKKE